MRDIENDTKNNKKTLAVSIGFLNAKKYHYGIVILAIVFALAYTLKNFQSISQFIYVIAFIPLLFNLVTVYKNKDPKLLDGELKKVALSTFVYSLLFSFFI